MNLFAVYQVKNIFIKTGSDQYDLILQNDLNTSGFTQWYYFSVKNT